MKYMSPEYRLAELAVLVRLTSDARNHIVRTDPKDFPLSVGSPNEENREYTLMALNELSDRLHDMIYDIAKEYVPRTK